MPLRKRIAEENLLRYNGMLIGVFELLADARAQIASVNSYIDALRDFWIAQADLDMALIGKPSLSADRRPRDGAPSRRGRTLNQGIDHGFTTKFLRRGRRGHRRVAPPRSARWRWPHCPSR